VFLNNITNLIIILNIEIENNVIKNKLI